MLFSQLLFRGGNINHIAQYKWDDIYAGLSFSFSLYIILHFIMFSLCIFGNLMYVVCLKVMLLCFNYCKFLRCPENWGRHCRCKYHELACLVCEAKHVSVNSVSSFVWCKLWVLVCDMYLFTFTWERLT